MKLLGAILKGLLLLLLIVIVLGLLTVLSWWLRWPMFTGFFILLGLFGAALLFWAGRFLWRLRDKRSFVRQALSGLKTPAAAEVQVSGIETVWNALLARDPGKRPDRREFLGRSWYLALDGAGSAAASAFSLSPLFTGKEESGPLARRDFASTTLLQAAAGALEGDGKEQFLALFARDVPGSAFSGFFLLLSARDLLSRADTALQEWGFQLRDALYSVMVATNRNAPLYLLVQDMDALPGGASLFARPKGGETLPGRFFDAGDAPDEGGERPGEAAARALAATLRTVLFDDLVQGAPAAQDELRFLEESGTLGRRLDAFFSALLQEMPRQEPLRLAGVFFCPTRPVRENSAGAPPDAVEAQAQAQTISARPNSALSRFFTRLLPAQGAAARGLRGRLSAYSSAWIVGMGAWYLVLLCVCGLMAANVLYQNRAITTLPPAVTHHMVSGQSDALHGEMRYIAQLEAAREKWLLPSFGIDMLARVEQEEKNRFVRDLYAKSLAPLLLRLRATLNAPGEYTAEKHAAVNQLAWLGHAVHEQLTTGKISAPAISFPSPSEEGNVNGEFIKRGLEWTANPEQLSILGEDVSSILMPFLARNFEQFADSTSDYYDTVNVGMRLCLSQYWPHLFGNEQEDMCIPAYYTAAGYALNRKFLLDFLDMPGGKYPQLRAKIDQRFTAYYARYEELWQNFVQRFCEVAQSLENSGAYLPFYNVQNVAQTPHMRLAARLGEELAPLKDAPSPPAWLGQARLFEVMALVALEGHASKDVANWHTLLVSGINAPDALQELWRATETRQRMREIYDGIMEMTLYLSAVRDILQELDNPAWVLATARAHFGARDVEALKASLYAQSDDHWKNVQSVFDSAEIPQLRLYENLLDFAGNGIAVSAALALQNDWENKVLSSPAHLHRGNDVSLMFGQEGAVSEFIAAELSPFIQRREDGIAAAIWDKRPFPFTQDFLFFLASGEEFAMTAAAAGKNPGVLLRSMPTLLNVEAKTRANSTTLTLWCQEKTWQLTNRNYPHNERFTYDKGQCGKTELAIAFPDFEVKLDYPDFVAFVEDFQYGERNFVPQDFPASADFLSAAGITNLRVRIFPDNVALLLKEKNANIPEMPDRITYVR